MRIDITEGAILSDYELPDHTDTPRKLSFLQGDDPMILTLNRGVYCPKDRQKSSQNSLGILYPVAGKPAKYHMLYSVGVLR